MAIASSAAAKDYPASTASAASWPRREYYRTTSTILLDIHSSHQHRRHHFTHSVHTQSTQHSDTMRSEPPSSGPFASLDDHVARLDGLSTPPYRCQKQFGLYQGGHAKWQVADRFESFVIMDALEIARRFVGSPLGLYFSSMALLFADTEERLSGSCATHVTMTNNTVHQERMRNQILDFLDGDNVEIRIDVKTRSDAYVSSPDHKVIYVRLEVSRSIAVNAKRLG